MPKHRVIVTGATNQIGHFLLPALVKAGHPVIAVSRKPPPERLSSAQWIAADLGNGVDPRDFSGTDTLIHAASISSLPRNIPSFAEAGVGRIIVFSSTSVFTKTASPSHAERMTARRLAEGEKLVESECEELDIAWTIFRPTLIYGCGMDRNITSIARFIRRFGFFPVAGRANGLRQPVHAEDLASACLAVMDNKLTFSKAYNLSGGDPITYRRMAGEVFAGMGKTPRIITIPAPLFSAAAGLVSFFLPSFNVTRGMVDRMNADLVFDHSQATGDFGYCPRNFIYTG